MTPRRSSQEIRFAVLKEIGNGNKQPTRIIYASNTSWKTFQEILSILLSNELITEEINKRRKTYHITEKGEKALNAYTDSRATMSYKIDKEWIRNIEEVRWALELLELEQSDEWCVILGTLIRTTEPFTVGGLSQRLDILPKKMRKLMNELKQKSIVAEHKVSFPEDWDSLSKGARAKRAKKMGLVRGWHRAKYLVFDRDKFEELIYESVERRMDAICHNRQKIVRV